MLALTSLIGLMRAYPKQLLPFDYYVHHYCGWTT